MCFCDNNPISDWINLPNDMTLNQKIHKINTLYNFQFTYYLLKCKKRLRSFYYLKVKEPLAIEKYHPDYLKNNLKEDTDLDKLLENW
jgi:hypothetical protein